jgi:hypothetical protein
MLRVYNVRIGRVKQKEKKATAELATRRVFSQFFVEFQPSGLNGAKPRHS